MLFQPTTRRFADYGWAWPTGSLDQILKAALMPNEERALATARDWLDRHDIDLALAAEHGLLAIISGRFGNAISDDPTYPRLIGLRRQRWTQSRLVGAEAEPVLNAISQRGIPLLLIKGAALVASDPSAKAPPSSIGIDLVIGDQHVPAALAILQRLGWQATNGVSWQYLESFQQSIPAMRFFAGVYGELTLHRDAYPSVGEDRDGERLWRQALVARYHGVPVLVPSAPDAAALAIAHGAIGGTIDGEWIVDCARALGTDGFSWSEFTEIVERRGLSVPAMVVLSYLSQEVGISVPTSVLQRAAALADRSGFWTRLGVLLRVMPCRNLSRTTRLACSLAKKSQRRQERKSRAAISARPSLRGRRELPRRSAPAPAIAMAARHRLDLPPLPSGTRLILVKLLIETAPPEVPRRLIWEINGVSRHVARLRYRTLRGRTALLVLRFEGKLRFDLDDGPVTIESRPTGRLRRSDGKNAAARYGALPFRVLEAQLKPCDPP